MQNKNSHRWLDVQIVIMTLAMTVSLALWNLFASKNQTVTQTQATTPSLSSPQVTIYFGNPAPQAPAITAPSNDTPAISAPSAAPMPVTTTRSSRP
jgi:cytoskeletal protein RodZ